MLAGIILIVAFCVACAFYVFKGWRNPEYEELGATFSDCFSSVFNRFTLGFTESTDCSLPNNITVSIMKSMGRVFICNIIDGNNNGTYLIKYSVGDKSCTQLWQEFINLKMFSQKLKHNSNKTNINIANVHPTLPYYFFYGKYW